MDPSNPEVPAETVLGVAQRYGIEMDPETADEFTFGVRSTAGLLEDLDPGTPSAAPPSVVEPGDDPHNAFRYRFRAGGESGPLSDLDVAVKDNIAVAGVEMTCGSEGLSFEPPYDASVVDRLRSAGATVVGTTNMDEFAYFTTGETCAHGRVDNPVVEGAVPGGSSAGSGAAVAAGEVPVALGSDTGGSIRIPASFCGVVGLKPTHGAVPRFGFADLAPSLDHVGPLAESVETAARAFEAIAGPDPYDPSTLTAPDPEGVVDAVERDVDGLRAAVVTDSMALSDGGVTAAVESAATDLAEAGVRVDRVPLDGYGDAGLALSFVSGAEFASVMASNGQTYGTGTGYAEPWLSAVEGANESGAYGDNVRKQLIDHGTLTAVTGGRNYVLAQNARREFVAGVSDLFDTYDALLTPTTAVTAPGFGEIADDAGLLQTIANTAPFNLTGHPALSVPCGEADGAPVGLQVVADYHEEATAVALGAEVERTRP
jgi:Asp-tRNA(Asn)/Glu-tRNA(Gln) amidotransferase A subunit family amidase